MMNNIYISNFYVKFHKQKKVIKLLEYGDL